MPKRKPLDAPLETLSIRTTNIEVFETADGQHEFTGIAQFYDHVNDRLMVFRKGAFAKTIVENVGAGKVKINDGHIRTSQMTVGKVLEAEERSDGVWYRGVLSATASDLATKLKEGIVDENSVEIHILREQSMRIPLEDVPPGAFIWDQIGADGTVEGREILEVAWTGLAIVPNSAQARKGILHVNSAVPFQDLPVAAAGTSWEPEEAAGRVLEFAGKWSTPSGGECPNWSKLSSAHLVRGPMVDGAPVLLGAICDVIDGALTVIPDAIEPALEALAGDSNVTGPDAIACAQNVGRYIQKLEELAAMDDSAVPSGSVTAEDPAGPATSHTEEEPPTDDNRNEALTAHEAKLVDEQLRVLTLSMESFAARHPEVNTHEPAGTSGVVPPRGDAGL